MLPPAKETSIWSQCAMIPPTNSLEINTDDAPPPLVHPKKSFLRALLEEPNDLAMAMKDLDVK